VSFRWTSPVEGVAQDYHDLLEGGGGYGAS
jgi:hypothetical protein